MTNLRKYAKPIWRWTRYPALLFLILLLVFFTFCLPDKIFDKPTSTIVTDRDGQLLSAHIAADGQWRFPELDSVPEKFKACIIHFEDRNFESHPGFYLPSILRAAKQNLKAGKVVSGGSTLTMQVVRLSRDNPNRTITEKVTEIIRAVRLESRFSKEKILRLYASHAPFGGNVVGLESASWRYFGRPAHELSWAESATLAVLPNAPSLIFPGKNDWQLLNKRNRLLNDLWLSGRIDSTSCALAKVEPLPKKPSPLPQLANHLLSRCEKDFSRGMYYKTTLAKSLQTRSLEIVNRHVKKLGNNGIHNAACIIADVNSGEVLSYVGNASTSSAKASYVDLIDKPRSSGSILKPFLYAAMLSDGDMLPNTLVADIPTNYNGYAPKNYDEKFRGSVAAGTALSMSLNVPTVRMLRAHGIERFHYRLQKLGLNSINQSASHYGLSLILGGAEVSLWNLTKAYCGMSADLTNYTANNGHYDPGSYSKLHYALDNRDERPEKDLKPKGVFSAASIYRTFEAMQTVNRPESQVNWESFRSSKKVAWKTGTSFGHRDAWAIGITPQHIVAVWVGNADGEGRPGLSGVTSAAPILFDLFDLTEDRGWFPLPYDEMSHIAVCRKSGHRVSTVCPAIDSLWVPASGLKTVACPYHKLIHLDQSEKYRVTSGCHPVSKMKTIPWFLLPPIQEWYYSRNHPGYKKLPPWLPSCEDKISENTIDIIYPRGSETVYLPFDFSSTRNKLIAEATHRNSDALIYWHLDDQYLGKTEDIHQMEILPDAGDHVLTLVDENGNTVERYFTTTEGK